MMKRLLEFLPIPIHRISIRSQSKDAFRWILRFAVLVLLCTANTSLHAQVKLASIFSDNMVLQQNQQVKIWGTAPAGRPVTVKASWNETVSTRTNDEGQWEACLTTPKAGLNSYELSVVSNQNTVTLKNVVTGEVWFCSGQSNMNFQLRRSKGVQQDTMLANDPQIRLFRSGKTGWQVSTYDIAKDFSAVGFYFGLAIRQKLNVPVGLIQSTVGGSPAEAWTPLETLQNDPTLKVVVDRWNQWLADYNATDASAYDAALRQWEAKRKRDAEPLIPRSVYSIKRYHHQRGILFRDKVEPFIPFAIKGVIWYQGEGNVEWGHEYEHLFSSLITAWRSAWGQGDFPFFFVQIPPYNYPDRFGKNRSLQTPILREGQNRAQALPNTGMVCTMDIGDPNNVHPNIKKPVGERLALIALAKTYGFNTIEYSGPTFRRCSVSDAVVTIEFDHTAQGLVARDGPAKWFELAGPDGVFHPATTDLEGHKAIVSSDSVTEPTKIRYAWLSASMTNLFNSEGLPAVPFLVDTIGSSTSRGGGSQVVPERVLDRLVREHPRLMLKEDALQDLKEQAKNDQVLQRFVHEVCRQADERLDDPKLLYTKRGPRLLHVSKACVERIYDLGIAWRWTGEKKYAEKIKENLLAVCDFPDWNPSHFLDTAEMSHAVGIGYDWTHDTLDEQTRDRIRSALVELGLKPGIERYKSKYKHFTYAYNWNQVCNGGLLIGALAIADEEPETAGFIVTHALKHLPTALGSYAPDGVWAEGIGYWNYATSYTAFALTSLETSLGSDFGLSRIPGLSQTGYVPIYSSSPTGLLFSYADAGDFKRRKSAACMFWLARTFDNLRFSDSEHDLIGAGEVSPFHIIWYMSPSGKTPVARELDRLLRGEVETALFRSDWDDPEALFIGVKAGYNQAHHGHLDLGNFEMDALGVRWARDLGSDNYNLPEYWTYRQGGTRWTYYRLNSFSHNVPVLGGENQNANATATMTRFETSETFPFAEIDLTEAYAAHASSVQRGVALVGNRRAVLVQDEFELVKPCEVVWGMTTDAAITLEGPGVARLRLKGRELSAQILSPSGAKFTVESAEQAPPQKSNKGVSRLLVRLSSDKGNTRIAVLLAPEWQDGISLRRIPVKPLEAW